MNRLIALSACALLASTAAFADEKPSAAEAAKIKEALAAWGCSGGEYEKESEASGVYEVDDAKCVGGAQYDVKLNSNFVVRSITAD
jgi:hypothetical protein